MTNKFTYNFYVSGNECDVAGNYFAHALQSKLLDCAIAHADELGVSRRVVQDSTGGVWVLIRLSVKLNRPLVYGDEFTIDTWPTGVKGPYFGRDAHIRCGDEIIGTASSAWLVADPHSKRIVRPKELPANLGDSVATIPDKLTPPVKLTHIGQREVKYTDIDMNNHVNNTRYLAFVGDALELHIEKQRITAWQISYNEQCVAGEVIEFYRGMYDDGSIHIAGEVDGKRRFDVRITITQ